MSDSVHGYGLTVAKRFVVDRLPRVMPGTCFEHEGDSMLRTVLGTIGLITVSLAVAHPVADARTASSEQVGLAATASPCVSATGSPDYSHVVIIMDENVSYATLNASSQAPTSTTSPRSAAQRHSCTRRRIRRSPTTWHSPAVRLPASACTPASTTSSTRCRSNGDDVEGRTRSRCRRPAPATPGSTRPGTTRLSGTPTCGRRQTRALSTTCRCRRPGQCDRGRLAADAVVDHPQRSATTCTASPVARSRQASGSP